MGANTILYTLPQTHELCAAIAVQPSTAAVFAEGYANDLLGPAAGLVRPLVETAYGAITGVPLGALQPAFAAAGADIGRPTPVLFVQCKADRWGTLADAGPLAAATPGGQGLSLLHL